VLAEEGLGLRAARGAPRATTRGILEAGSYLRLIHSCITQLKAQGPSRTCNESKEEEEKDSGFRSLWCGASLHTNPGVLLAAKALAEAWEGGKAGDLDYGAIN